MDAKVFGIGLSRTGTVSLTAALNVLGIDAVHYPNDAATQEELKAGRYRLSVLDRVQALTDIPSRRSTRSSTARTRGASSSSRRARQRPG